MYYVTISSRAERDIDEQHDWWAEHRSAAQAARWYEGFAKAIQQLSEVPEHYPFARENGAWPFEVRQLTFGLGRRPSHRAVFRIRGNEVIVLRTRHVAQSDLSYDDIRSDA